MNGIWIGIAPISELMIFLMGIDLRHEIGGGFLAYLLPIHQLKGQKSSPILVFQTYFFVIRLLHWGITASPDGHAVRGKGGESHDVFEAVFIPLFEEDTGVGGGSESDEGGMVVF